jgi:hypothetical protein
MLYFAAGVVVGVFLPTAYAYTIKSTVNAVWAWAKAKISATA